MHGLPMRQEHTREETSIPQPLDDYYARFAALLGENLDFHGEHSGYASHNFHSFPAKFPPQLPRLFIEALTRAQDVVLDPMAGSGTTIVEAVLAGRRGIGFDIDPLAVLLATVKTAALDALQASEVGEAIVRRARATLREEPGTLMEQFERRWDTKTRQFVNYWFAEETQLELLALAREIEQVADLRLRRFFEIILSSIIITKSGGVSYAFDLAHTRPHRAKVILAEDGRVLLGHELAYSDSRRVRLLTKTLRAAIDEFEKRMRRNLAGLFAPVGYEGMVSVQFGDAQRLPLAESSVDLIVTSPPYASNAIDYMRAHKFSLVWLGYPIERLGQMRKEYIGGEAVAGVALEDLPGATANIVASVARLNEKKGQVVGRYYSEMMRVLREMYRVLRPGRGAILVVGTSMIQGKDIQIGSCLIEIGEAIGFQSPGVAIRNLDRDRRMLPAGAKGNNDSQIQQRMHEEFVIGFYKPTR